MKRLLFIVLLFFGLNVYGEVLNGKWESQNNGQRSTLEFVSQNQLLYNGEMLYYQIVNNTIQVADDYGFVNYPYKLQQGKLYIQFPEGYKLTFVKYKKKREKLQSTSGNDTYLLRGKLCSYSSSYNGGYSHSDMLYFDGQGHYSTRAQTYSSGNSGAYVNEGNSDGGGSYSVHGINISVHVAGGNSFNGKVTQRDRRGNITGIEVNGKIFATGLCD